MAACFDDKHSYEQISEFDKYEVHEECVKICMKFDNRGITWCICNIHRNLLLRIINLFT